MNRLVVNPGTPQAWEIQLKPGINFLGRGASNDFKFEDASVSGSHCEVIVENGIVTLKDMGSTNGTFVNQSKVQQIQLQSGQAVRLGSVEMVFYGDAARPVTVTEVAASPGADVIHIAPAAAPDILPAAPVTTGLKISGLSHAPLTAVSTTSAPPIAPAAVEEPQIETGTRYCKFHPKSPARYSCHKCNRTFCELCVSSRQIGGKTVKTCRSCGVEVFALQFKAAAQKSFYARLPGAFVFPFKGFGIVILLCATVAFSAMDFVSGRTIFGIITKVSLYGLTFLFLQNILHTTTSDEEESLGFPEPSGLSGAAFQLGGTVLASFWPWIGLTIAKFFDVSIPVEALTASAILGGLYFPMAFLAVAMKDSVAAANPLVVIPAIMKIPVQYLITAALLISVFGVRQLGQTLSNDAGTTSMTTKDMGVFFMAAGAKALLALVSVYLLTVMVRILGLLYNSTKDKLGWFAH